MHTARPSTWGAAPACRFLANGRYTALVTAAGTGYSTLGPWALTPWRADPVEDPDGLFLYVRDLDTGEVWSLGHHPLQRPTAEYETIWEPGRSTIARTDEGIESRLEVCVPPDAGAEIRRLTFRNRSARRRCIEITTWADVALAPLAAHFAHPVFSKLFVQTEWVPARSALLARRRPRAASERHPWLVHAALDGPVSEYESDRGRFLGRGGTPRAPRALRPGVSLSGTAGNVLDPCVALRCVVELGPGESVERSFLLGAAEDRDAALALQARYAASGGVAAGFEAASAAASSTLARLGIEARTAEVFEALAGALMYGAPELRSSATPIQPGAATVTPGAIPGLPSGYPFAVLHAETPAGAALLPRVLQMHRYWRTLDLPVEVVLVVGKQAPAALDAGEPAGRLRVLRADDAAPGALEQIDAIASWVIRDSIPELPSAISGLRYETATLRAETPRATYAAPSSRCEAEPLRFFNGRGGFTEDGREYVMRLSRGDDGALRLPPQPWTNVIANERFGCLVSETGAGCTWSGNSREHRITPWSNDPVTDAHGEALYLRDETSGEFWSPLPGPRPGPGDYEVRHGIGSSTWSTSSAGIETETRLFVAERDPIRFLQLRIRNTGSELRRLSAFGFVRLVLGGRAEESGRFVVTEIERRTATIRARNPMAGEYARAVAFAAVVPPAHTLAVHATADRARFVGRHGSLAAPVALFDPAPLDGSAGAGLDACAAQQVVFDLSPGERAEVAFLLGEGADENETNALVARYTVPGEVARALDAGRASWEALVGAIQIVTPAPALDLVMNGWLLYQVLACRIWGRTAFYQSGGAYGFRDQLQDASALVYAAPERFRTQILLHAAHQFKEGDVLHWWHPPLGKGLRTRFADDLLWLPYLTAFYVRTTGDVRILGEKAPFLAARALEPGEDEAYLLPEPSGEVGDVYEHCSRALDRSLACGAHGLPLFGTGDWNDGMNRVGREGRGESVWMGFFLYTVLGEFLPLCEARGDGARARRYAAHREDLRRALESDGWDGAWYRRGYYDDGTPLGSSTSDECRVDALVQAWAVLSGAAPAERASRALDAVEEQLVSEKDGLIRLLWPPFDRTPHDPGYIKGYVPGVRENGGQYTHAALWVVRAIAEMGRNDRAARLLEMLSPVTRSATPERVDVYQVEPYVAAADVYGTPPHVGRGGWTWYTGSAAWMVRVLLESILGLRVVGGETLELAPCVPNDWPRFEIAYRLPGGKTRYDIHATNPHRSGKGVREARVDGEPAPVIGGVARISIEQDGCTHRVDLVLGALRGA